jgi:hypothetical protein
MKPRLDSLDIVVAIGMFATIIGGVVLVIASYGVLGAGMPDSTVLKPLTIPTVMNALQKSMDETRAEASRMSHQFNLSMDRVTKHLSALSGKYEHLVQQPSIAETVQARFEQTKAEHNGQIQYLTGTIIVTLTGQGIRSGALTVNTLYGSVNDRIIRTAQKYAALGQGRFNGESQAILGRWIVDESQARHRLHAQIQEEMGQAIVQKASMERANLLEKAQLQDQLRTLVAAAVRTEATQTLLAQLQQAEKVFQGTAGTAAAAKPIMASSSFIWKELPVGLPLALMILLPALLMWALTFPRASSEKTVNITRLLELAGEISGRSPMKRA